MRISPSQLQDLVTIIPLAGEGPYGGVDGESYTSRALVEHGSRLVLDSNGQEIAASGFAILPADSRIGPGDSLIVDGGRYETVEVQAVRIGRDIHHIEAYFKSLGEDE